MNDLLFNIVLKVEVSHFQNSIDESVINEIWKEKDVGKKVND